MQAKRRGVSAPHGLLWRLAMGARQDGVTCASGRGKGWGNHEGKESMRAFLKFQVLRAKFGGTANTLGKSEFVGVEKQTKLRRRGRKNH